MELVAGETLVRKNKETVSADEALEDKKVVGFYFSAHWCGPCVMFTPILADFYKELIKAGKQFEIIFVSSDESAEDMFNYMNELHGDWLAVPHGSELLKKIEQKFNVEGIPSLIVLRKDGTIITADATNDVETKGPQLFDDWEK